MIALFFQARGEKRRGKKGGSPSNEFLESLGPGSSAVGSQGSSDAGEYIRLVLEESSMKIITFLFKLQLGSLKTITFLLRIGL